MLLNADFRIRHIERNEVYYFNGISITDNTGEQWLVFRSTARRHEVNVRYHGLAGPSELRVFLARRNFEIV